MKVVKIIKWAVFIIIAEEKTRKLLISLKLVSQKKKKKVIKSMLVYL